MRCFLRAFQLSNERRENVPDTDGGKEIYKERIKPVCEPMQEEDEESRCEREIKCSMLLDVLSDWTSERDEVMGGERDSGSLYTSNLNNSNEDRENNPRPFTGSDSKHVSLVLWGLC